MTTSTAVQWRKEVRELLPFWAATVVIMIACWALMRPDAMPTDWLFNFARGAGRGFLLSVGLIAYAAGAVTLGAISIGNEYSHETLTPLLVQPVARAQVLRVKLVVLALMQAMLGGLAFATWGAESGWDSIAGDFGRSAFIVLPLAAGLLLAPWLTMVGRNALGGAAFTVVLPSVLWMAAIYVRLPAPLIWTAAAALAIVGPVMTWRTFLSLEVTGSSQESVDLSTWFSRSGDHARVARTQHPVWILVKKELRLQHATFVVSGLYVAVWLMIVVDRGLGLQLLTSSPLFVATFVNTALIPVFCGALASAGERQFGVSDWQTLLPIAGWRQWAIKAAVALGLTFALAVVLPRFLVSIATEAGWRDGSLEPVSVLFLCAAALYVSSLSTTGLRALLATVPAIGVAAALVSVLFRVGAEVAQPLIESLARILPFVEITRADFSWWIQHGTFWLAGGFFLLLLAFGHANHRTPDRNWRRIATQWAWLSAYVISSGLFLSLIGQLMAVWMQRGGGR